MRTLAEMLCRKTGKDLFLMSRRRKLPLPGEWTDAEAEEAMLVYYSDTNNEEFSSWFLQNWENGEFKRLKDNPEDREAEERYQEWLDSCLRISRRLRSINENKKNYAKILSDDLLKPESIRSLLLDLQNPCIQSIRDICAGTVKENNGFYPITCEPDKNWQYLILESKVSAGILQAPK